MTFHCTCAAESVTVLSVLSFTPQGSRFYENELKKEQQLNQRIEKMMLQKAQITEQQLKKAHVQVKPVVVISRCHSSMHSTDQIDLV